MKKFLLLSFILICTGAFSQKKRPIVEYTDLWHPQWSALKDSGLYLEHSSAINRALLVIQSPASHLWQRAGWWNAANIMEAMIDYSRISETNCPQLCRQIYRAIRHKMLGSFRNWAYDDSGWWAMAWLKAYDRYHRSDYLKTAEKIFTYLVNQGWDDRCGGGMNWMRNHPYKNAVTNELFILLAARLAGHQTDTVRKAYYLNWAIKDYSWLNQSGMLNADHLYNDGLDKDCKNNHGNTWTYNQGVILAAEKELYTLTGDEKYLRSARQTALACMRVEADKDSILTDKLGKDAGLDCPQFKGIFIRELAELNTVLKDPAISHFIMHNAEVAWSKAQNAGHLFDFKWQGPFKDWTGVATGAALDLMNAAAMQLISGEKRNETNPATR
jgi:predicted alpha-1,6-mannanase (GH76 family)